MQIKTKSKCFALFAGVFLATNVFADAIKTYQVTGPVLEVNDKMILVEKGNEKWEIARDAATKVNGNLKVGEKVTIYYRMTATSVEIKDPAAKGEVKKKKTP